MSFSPKIWFYILIVILPTSCDPFEAQYGRECKNRGGDCPGIVYYMIDPLPFEVGDSIKFKNENGTRIGFRVEIHQLNYDSNFGCRQTGSASCYCGQCVSGQYFEVTTDDLPMTSGNSNVISLANSCTWTEGKLTSNRLKIQALGAEIERSNYSPFLPEADEYYTSYELGGIKYKDVYVYNDTLNVISKVYVNMQLGVIGFYEKETPSTFYLSDD